MTSIVGFIFDSPDPIIEAWDALHPPQHDAHVKHWRTWVAAYGDWEGYYTRRLARARSNSELMRTEKGRAWLARTNASHAAWRSENPHVNF